VILVTASILVLFGFVLFVAGNLFDQTALAVVGGVIVVGIGSSVVDSGLQHKVGEQRVITNETANRTVVNTDAEYREVQMPMNLPFGFLILLVGALLVFQPLTKDQS